MIIPIANVRRVLAFALLAIAPLAARAGESALVRQMVEAHGPGSDNVADTERQFQAFAEQLSASGRVIGNERCRAEAIHAFVHREILRGKYDISGNDLAATLSGGPFNCVTASGLFLALAERFDLDAQPVSVVGHVWCRIATPAGPFDVETTCRDWFALSAAGNANTVTPAPALAEHSRRAEEARVLDEPGLIAIFHYNRGLRLLKEQQFHAAAAANLQALKLDPLCAPARENLLVTLNDWSLALAAHGNAELSLELLGKAALLAPDYQPFQINRRYLSLPENSGPAAKTLPAPADSRANSAADPRDAETADREI